jgi:hypothetical protein
MSGNVNQELTAESSGIPECKPSHGILFIAGSFGDMRCALQSATAPELQPQEINSQKFVLNVLAVYFR